MSQGNFGGVGIKLTTQQAKQNTKSTMHNGEMLSALS